jgi:hypothetical protein
MTNQEKLDSLTEKDRMFLLAIDVIMNPKKSCKQQTAALNVLIQQTREEDQ